MADLDDFFAKKDKKKSKTTKKFTTTDDLAKKLEETSKKTEKLKKEKMTASSVPTNNLAQDIVADETAAPAFNDGDEWKEFIEEKKDYSGLKIQHLQISENDAENGDQNDSNDDGFDEEGNETQPGSRRKQGPWKMVAPQPQPEPEPEPKPVETPPPSAQPASGKYVSPAVRQAMMNARQAERAPLKSLKKNATPNLEDKESFPTLDQAKKAPASTSAWGKKRVEDSPQPSAVFRDSRTIRGPPSFSRSMNSDDSRSSDYNRSDYNRSDYNRRSDNRSDYNRPPSDNRYSSLRDNRS